jgi:hypothetical protein
MTALCPAAASELRLFRDYAYGHDMTVYGEPSPALAALFAQLEGQGHVTFHRFSLFQGLDSDIEVREEARA